MRSGFGSGLVLALGFWLAGGLTPLTSGHDFRYSNTDLRIALFFRTSNGRDRSLRHSLVMPSQASTLSKFSKNALHWRSSGAISSVTAHVVELTSNSRCSCTMTQQHINLSTQQAPFFVTVQADEKKESTLCLPLVHARIYIWAIFYTLEYAHSASCMAVQVKLFKATD